MAPRGRGRPRSWSRDVSRSETWAVAAAVVQVAAEALVSWAVTGAGHWLKSQKETGRGNAGRPCDMSQGAKTSCGDRPAGAEATRKCC